jgi:hypothetical protein
MAIKSDNKRTTRCGMACVHFEIFPCIELNALKQTTVFLSFIIGMLFWYISDLMYGVQHKKLW